MNSITKKLMISLHPSNVKEIISGNKTIEVRPWTINLNGPIEVLLYCTKSKCDKDNVYMSEDANTYSLFKQKLNGKVFGKFRLNKISQYSYNYGTIEVPIEDLSCMCMTQEELNKDGNGKDLYGFHIEDFELFKAPLDVKWYATMCKHYGKPIDFCKKKNCNEIGYDSYIEQLVCGTNNGKIPLTVPPQKYYWVVENFDCFG